MVGYGSGVETALKYQYEPTFKGTPTDAEKCFGGDQAITTLAFRNSLEKLYQYGNREVWKTVPKQFEGALGLEFTLSNPWWLAGLFGEKPAAEIPYRPTE